MNWGLLWGLTPWLVLGFIAIGIYSCPLNHKNRRGGRRLLDAKLRYVIRDGRQILSWIEIGAKGPVDSLYSES